MSLIVVGAVVMILYYVSVIAVSSWAALKERKLPTEEAAQEGEEPRHGHESLRRLFLANRTLPLALSFTSMTATWVGAGYINGTAEAVFNYGLVWCQTPLGYAISLVIGGQFFAEKMRTTQALTMLDPFQRQYGPWIVILLSVPAICGEVFWSAANLSALGNTVRAIAHLDFIMIIFVTTFVVVFYTTLGGIFSVTYTDAFQVCCTIVGLLFCLGFIVKSPAVGEVGPPHRNWLGEIEGQNLSPILDQLLMTIFGGIPWQVYFQRVLSCDTAFNAKFLSYMSALGCVFFALPSVVVGALAKSTNFTLAGYDGEFNLNEEDRQDVLPNALHYLTPEPASILGQLAITSAVMSSVDSSLMSASSLVTHNVYHQLVRPAASEDELCWVFRFSVCLIGMMTATMALKVQSVFALWTLSSDLVYVLLFPQFVALFFLRRWSNAYGAVFGFTMGMVTRTLCGEPAMGVPVFLRLPLYNSELGQQFPFRTLCMVLSLCCLLAVSALSAHLFRAGHLPRHLDLWSCFTDHHLVHTASLTGGTRWPSGHSDAAVVLEQHGPAAANHERHAYTDQEHKQIDPHEKEHDHDPKHEHKHEHRHDHGHDHEHKHDRNDIEAAQGGWLQTCARWLLSGLQRQENPPATPGQEHHHHHHHSGTGVAHQAPKDIIAHMTAHSKRHNAPDVASGISGRHSSKSETTAEARGSKDSGASTSSRTPTAGAGSTVRRSSKNLKRDDTEPPASGQSASLPGSNPAPPLAGASSLSNRTRPGRKRSSSSASKRSSSSHAESRSSSEPSKTLAPSDKSKDRDCPPL